MPFVPRPRPSAGLVRNEDSLDGPGGVVIRKPALGGSVIRLELNGPVEGLTDGFLAAREPVKSSPQISIMGFGRDPGARGFWRQRRAMHFFCDILRKFLLQQKQVTRVTNVTLRPNMGIRNGVNQLHRYAHAAIGLASGFFATRRGSPNRMPNRAVPKALQEPA
jgi:hypothetical protein